MDWWPLTRDCAMFTFNVTFLLWFAWDGKIYLWEATLLLALVIFYYVVMFNSSRLSKFMKRKFEEEYRWCNRNIYGASFYLFSSFFLFASLPFHRFDVLAPIFIWLFLIAELKPANNTTIASDNEPHRTSSCIYIVTADDFKLKEIAAEKKAAQVQNGHAAAVPTATSKNLIVTGRGLTSHVSHGS